MPHRTSTPAFLMLALLSACANSGTGSAPAPSVPSKDSQALAQQAHVNCGGEAACSPSVGLLTVGHSQGVTKCTASLIDEDTVLTAAHCLPDEILDGGASCSGRVWIHFAKTGAHFETHLECLTVLSASSLSDRSLAQPDVAFLKLVAKVKRPPLKIDRSGFVADASYSVIQVDPINEDTGVDGRLKTGTCHAIQGSEILPGSTRTDHSVVTIADCATDVTSAGAPLVDRQGQIRGVVQAPVPWSRLQKRIGSRKLLEPSIAAMSWATNLACVRLPKNDEDFIPPSACYDDPNRRSEQGRKSLDQRLITQISQGTNVQSYFKSSAPDLTWESKAIWADSEEGRAIIRGLGNPTQYSTFAIPAPQCISENSPYTGGSFALPVVGFMYALDRYLTLNLDQGEYLGSIPARIDIEDGFFRPSYFGDQKVATLYILQKKTWLQISRAKIPICR